MLSNLNKRIIKSGNKQDDAELDNIRVSVFRGEKVAAATAAASKPAIKKLLTALINVILERKRQDGQDMSMRRI